MITITKALSLLLLGTLVSTALAAPPKPKAKPNVVFILADDLGVNDVSLYGSTFYETPNIDALARRGMKFTQAYSASPLCSPTRSSILSGLFPARTGITAPECHLPKEVFEKHLVQNAAPAQKALTAESVTRFKTEYYTLAKAFKADGYTTAHFGKWHLGPEPYSPLQQGFDFDVPHTPAPSPLGKGFFYPFPVWKGHGKLGDNLEDLVADEAVAFIAQHKDKPFFLNYWSFEAHSPWQAKKQQIDKYRTKADPKSLQRNPVYAGMIETLDEVVGRLVVALDKAGVLDNTIIIFTSDNGPFIVPNKEHMPEEFHKVPVTSAQPLRAGKGNIYEAGTRVPLVVVWPGKVKPASQSAALIQSTDFFPTFVDMLGWKLPTRVHFDGMSQRQVLEKNKAVRQEIFCHFPHGQGSNVYEAMPAPTPSTPASSVRVGDWKLIRFYCDGPEQTNRHELYNLKDDQGERRDLASVQPERVTQLASRLDALLKDTEAVIPLKNPAYNQKPKSKTITDAEGWVRLFNGENLDGWERHSGTAEYRVEDGAIVGKTVAKSPNTFLCTKQTYGDFILEFEFKVADTMNSGVQFRSQFFDKPTEFTFDGKPKKLPADRVHGYQYEIDPSARAFTGGIYDEGRRGWLVDLKENEAARKAFKKGEWNLARIECRGDQLQTWINGVKAAELKDSLTLRGVIALQVHGIGASKKAPGEEVRWRNLRIKNLDKP